MPSRTDLPSQADKPPNRAEIAAPIATAWRPRTTLRAASGLFEEAAAPRVAGHVVPALRDASVVVPPVELDLGWVDIRREGKPIVGVLGGPSMFRI